MFLQVSSKAMIMQPIPALTALIIVLILETPLLHCDGIIYSEVKLFRTHRLFTMIIIWVSVPRRIIITRYCIPESKT